MNDQEKTATLAMFTELYESLNAESDRGVVLVCASLVENAIEDHIRRRLIPSVTAEDELMGRSAMSPIGSFSAKIDLAYRLGLFPSRERSIYHQLRQLRNACAHQIDQQDFTRNHFKDRVFNMITESEFLWKIIADRVRPPELVGLVFPSVREYVEALGWRKSFQMFFSIVVAHKRTSALRIGQIQPLYAP